jgi:hypothetical protein
VLIVFLLPVPGARAQLNERLLHTFCSSVGCADGRDPNAPLIADSHGNLYGTTLYGGTCDLYTDGCGTIYELVPPAGGSGEWTENILYSFCSQAACADGGVPYSAMIMDAQSNLYGTASTGGSGGVVFELSPPASGSGAWTYSVLYGFCSITLCADGANPLGNLIFDSQGNLYGTTVKGGSSDYGTVLNSPYPQAAHPPGQRPCFTAFPWATR